MKDHTNKKDCSLPCLWVIGTLEARSQWGSLHQGMLGYVMQKTLPVHWDRRGDKRIQNILIHPYMPLIHRVNNDTYLIQQNQFLLAWSVSVFLKVRFRWNPKAADCPASLPKHSSAFISGILEYFISVQNMEQHLQQIYLTWHTLSHLLIQYNYYFSHVIIICQSSKLRNNKWKYGNYYDQNIIVVLWRRLQLCTLCIFSNTFITDLDA